MDKEQEMERWFTRRRLTLDLAGLTDYQRGRGSIFLGGSAASYVNPTDRFEYSGVNTVLFRWGDPQAEDAFALMLEHDDVPDTGLLFPFSASTVVGGQLWHLAVQTRDFDPTTAYRTSDDYVVMPFSESAGRETLDEFLGHEPRRPQLIGRVGQRWVLFELGMELPES